MSSFISSHSILLFSAPFNELILFLYAARRVSKFHLLNCYKTAHLSFLLHTHFLYLFLMYPKFCHFHIIYYFQYIDNEFFYDIDLLFLSVFLTGCGYLNGFVTTVHVFLQTGRLTQTQSSQLLQGVQSVESATGC
jgi:hypothetical protein